MVLESEGYEVLSIANGREALNLLKSGKRPGLILTDVMMPVMTGWEFLAEKTSDPSLASIPVIVLSAAEDRIPPEAGKIMEFLHKPASIEKLLAYVGKHYKLAP